MKKVLLVSALAHIAVFALLRQRPTPKLEEVAIEVITELDPVNVNVNVPVPPDPKPVATTREAEPRSSIGSHASTSTGSTASIASATPVASADPVAGNTSWIVNLGPGVDTRGASPALGIGGVGNNPFLVNPATGPNDAGNSEAPNPNAKRKDNTLAAELHAQDAMKGLNPAAGAVIHSLEDETRTSLAPLRGNATFRAIVDATGAVTGLNLLDSTGDRAGWNDARERTLAALQKKKLDMRGTNGALIDIRVESEMRLPSGATTRAAPGVQDGRLTMTGDLSDVGSSATRIVHARISSFQPL